MIFWQQPKDRPTGQDLRLLCYFIGLIGRNLDPEQDTDKILMVNVFADDWQQCVRLNNSLRAQGYVFIDTPNDIIDFSLVTMEEKDVRPHRMRDPGVMRQEGGPDASWNRIMNLLINSEEFVHKELQEWQRYVKLVNGISRAYNMISCMIYAAARIII